ncbi:hypothetical protein BOX15_Mlig012901g1 [Macrostomum lignano]|uniref:A2M domain-containing protein n=2 Tax=Macrostomum lignano TaxID=282301 RepID=A0A267E4F2_9PLAT|nr:hypothetical protein BOX15_Mlig012901g1 [Macrostomum lignano]
MAELLDAQKTLSSFSLKPYLANTDDFVTTSVLSTSNGVHVQVNQSSGIKLAYSAIISQDQIRLWSKLDKSDETLTELNSELLDDFIPTLSAVTFGIVETGEIVASYDDFSLPNVTGKLKLSSNLTDNTGEPQAGVRIGIAGPPNSFVFLTGIDASVNLIRSGQDILEDTVTGKLKGSVRAFKSWIRWSRVFTTGSVLKTLNLHLLTDGFFELERYQRPIFERRRLFDEGSPMMSLSINRAHAPEGPSPPAQPEKSQKRTYFPETMLWTMVETDASGRASESLQLPDTITSWDLTAFGISSRHAIQTVQRPFQVTSFKRFFAQLTLPHSLIRGESLLLRVLLFNFDSSNRLNINATLLIDSKAFELTALTAAGQPAEHAIVNVEANGVGLAVFGLRPKLVSEAAAVTVRARATWPDGRAEVDEVTRTLPVLPEGRTVRRAVTALLSLRGDPTGSNSSAETVQSAEMVEIYWPEAVQADGSILVPGSQLLSVSVVGDVLGPAMDGIGGLVRTPRGCGEQNMVDFAPAVFIYRYLRSAGSDSSATARLRQKALDAMRTGYQRELTYRRDDGSYSAFGKADAAGSVWLTAFVLSVYAQAAEFIAVDPAAVTGNSIMFLLSRQDPSGRFTEPEGARVLDTSLQGEAGKASLGMSAFICSALMDVRDAVELLPALRTPEWPLLPVSTALRRCVDLFKLEFKQRLADFDTRDMALAAYFLWRARLAGEGGDATKSLAKRVWEAFNARAESDHSARLYFWKGSVEVTAYGVLTALLAESSSEAAAAKAALPALQWLVSKQTDQGGFHDTQSTVVGIRAIAAFATATGASGPTRARIEIFAKAAAVAATNSSTVINIEPDDRRVVRRRLLGRGDAAAEFSSVTVRAEGTGIALATAAWQFNLRDPERRSLVADWTESSGLGLRLAAPPKVLPGAAFAFSVCARASGTQGMYILTISSPSGYSPEEFTRAGAVPGLQLVEAGPLQIVFYFDRLMAKKEVCVQSAWRRDVPVLDVQPQKITLQKYYNPELVNTVFYLDPALQSVGRCQACPDCPGCSPPPSP